MSRIAIPAIGNATGATADVYERVRKIAGGGVPNLFAALGHLAPETLNAALDAEGALASGSLSKQDLETIKLLVSEQTGCDYCVAAHVMLGKMTGLAPEALKKIRAGQPTGDARRDALIRFVLNLQTTRGTIPEAELSAIRAAGYSDTQLAEISLAIAMTIFTNTFNRINDTDVDFPRVG
ncbi:MULTISPECIES: carboxymuconolactone decarboxylase family protein [unclassified Caballeronia]|uniref:carboxymuconolactone decarboxylase family protein n=1 Tax=unclassified Caballeronia TaxID=2646786 RepID=UPI002862A4C5|nr:MULTISPECIES: carboxymuconolactone decarboxylase family protein [unclassified Caballeronia]MDR5815733.1 carboxymuconolactone decarboxylase family protein [Caballeronia sp. LZ033]MDR5822304.1 carboxymuconolactone decarboxylase family protein [Caballeronia sp. LZ043]MDR5883475.1 carboxymuconolactone decarboxylase family protein [Caballeronia sp. LZ032]